MSCVVCPCGHHVKDRHEHALIPTDEFVSGGGEYVAGQLYSGGDGPFVSAYRFVWECSECGRLLAMPREVTGGRHVSYVPEPKEWWTPGEGESDG